MNYWRKAILSMIEAPEMYAWRPVSSIMQSTIFSVCKIQQEAPKQKMTKSSAVGL